MSTYSLGYLPDPVLLRDLKALVARDCATTAALLAHLAEVDARELYLPAAHPSMFSYCVHELHLAEDAAFKRIRAARTARRFPAIFAALAEGRLHLSAIVMLTPYLTPENVDELLEAVAHKSKTEIERLLAERFPRPELAERIEAISPPTSTVQLAPGPVEAPGEDAAIVGCPAERCAPGRLEPSALARMESSVPRSELGPLGPRRYALHLAIGQSTHDKLRYAQALLGHQIPSGDLAQVFDRALDALLGELEKRKFAATRKPKRPAPSDRRGTNSARHIPSNVKRAVWARDGGQCTFVREAGRRCPARSRLEFDHIEPVARGGRATVEGMRLRCRAHNQFAAERTFSTEFMKHKRKVAQETARRRKAAEEVMPYLKKLGLRADEVRPAAALCESVPNASLEERLKVALSYFAKRPSARAASSLQTPM